MKQAMLFIVWVTALSVSQIQANGQHEHGQKGGANAKKMDHFTVTGRLVDATWFDRTSQAGADKDRVAHASSQLASGIPAGVIPSGEDDEKSMWVLLTNAVSLAPYANQRVKVEGEPLRERRAILPAALYVQDGDKWRQIQLASASGKSDSDEERQGDHHGSGQQEKSGTAQAGKEPHVPEPRADAAKVPAGYRVEVFVKDLTFPSSVEFDGAGNVYIAESGYSYGDDKAEPRILRVAATGQIEVVLAGEPLLRPVTDLLWYGDRVYVSHRGKISVLEKNTLRDLVTDLPSWGDHHNNQLTVGPDEMIYFGQGTVTNSGVVGLDNAALGWLSEHRDVHDLPARDIHLSGEAFESADIGGQGTVRTSPFQPFGKASGGGTIPGRTKAGGTVLRMKPDGSALEVYAWGLRNPFGLMWGPNGRLYCSENGLDERGSRPIANDREDLYVIEKDAWYGWPDFASGVAVTDPRFKSDRGPGPKFLMVDHPKVEEPVLTFPAHSGVTKIDFAGEGPFGHSGQMFVAFFGHMTPVTGVAGPHGAHWVLRVDPTTKETEVFFTAKQDSAASGHDGNEGSGAKEGHEPTSRHQHGSGKEDVQKDAQTKSADSEHDHGKSGMEQNKGENHGNHDMTAGPRRLVDVRFTPHCNAMYVADHGSMTVGTQGPTPIRNTGVVWRIIREGTTTSGPPADISARTLSSQKEGGKAAQPHKH